MAAEEMALLADHLEWNSFLKRAHIFSIGFKSGEFGGQAMGETLKDLRNSKVELLLCIGALSCMKIKEEGRSWGSKIPSCSSINPRSPSLSVF